MTTYVNTDSELLTTTELLDEIKAEYKHYVETHGQPEAEWLDDLQKHSVLISHKRPDTLGSEIIVGFSYITMDTIRYKAADKLAAINEFLSSLNTETTENTADTDSEFWMDELQRLEETVVEDDWAFDIQNFVDDYSGNFEGHLELLLTEDQPLSKRQ